MDEGLHTGRTWCAWPKACFLHIMPILAPHAAAGLALELRQRKPIDAPCIEHYECMNTLTTCIHQAAKGIADGGLALHPGQ